MGVFLTGPGAGEMTVVVVAGGLFEEMDMQAPNETQPLSKAILKIRTRFMRGVRNEGLTRTRFFSGIEPGKFY